jgi:hypothetical protein
MKQLATESPETQQMKGVTPTITSTSTLLIELTEDELGAVAGGNSSATFSGTFSSSSN